MDPVYLAMGLVFVVLGVASFRYPHRMRNHVSSREWQENPDAAKRKQEFRARVAGVFLVLCVGGPLILAGIVS